MNQIHAPIGMEPLVDVVQQCCFRAQQYHRIGTQPGHFILTLNEGNGRTTAANYLSRAFAQAGVRSFGGLDQMLEYQLDGSMEQLCQTLRSIRASAVYTNEYEGVIAWDVTVLAAHLGEEQTRLFFRELPDIAEHATLLFFLPAAPNRSQLLLMEKISTLLGPDQMHWVRIPPYSQKTLADITRQALTEQLNIRLENTPEMDAILQKLVYQTGTRNAHQAARLARTLTQQADFSEFIPVLKVQKLKALYSCLEKEVR